MQDNLVGYLLGALDNNEAAQLEARLKSDPKLKAQLELAAKSLRPLLLGGGEITPPPDLVTRTCSFVADAAANPVAGRLPANWSDQRAATASWKMVDLAVAASVLLGACLMCFPAINNARHHAQIAGCRNNLRQLGVALIEYSDLGYGFFPMVPSEGNLSVAGMYAPTLIDAGLVVDDHQFLCPASPQMEPAFQVPSLSEIRRARGQTLAVIQRRMGGQFGYSLGYRENGQLRGIANRGRNYFALMADAPGVELTTCELPRRKRHRHVLFESGRVCGLSNRTACWGDDELFVNDNGEVSAGVHVEDAVIGNSSTAPLPQLQLTAF